LKQEGPKSIVADKLTACGEGVAAFAPSTQSLASILVCFSATPQSTTV